MKIKIVISLLLVIALCSGCATSTTMEEVGSVNSPISAEEQAILDEMKAKENAAESTPKQLLRQLPKFPQSQQKSMLKQMSRSIWINSPLFPPAIAHTIMSGARN